MLSIICLCGSAQVIVRRALASGVGFPTPTDVTTDVTTDVSRDPMILARTIGICLRAAL